jgi:hypothetical protein
MCKKAECSKCGFSWNGKHVASVYESIEKGKHCACKPWPGVDTKAEEGSTSTEKGGHLSCSDLHQFNISTIQFAELILVADSQVKRRLEFSARRSLVLSLLDWKSLHIK